MNKTGDRASDGFACIKGLHVAQQALVGDGEEAHDGGKQDRRFVVSVISARRGVQGERGVLSGRW